MSIRRRKIICSKVIPTVTGVGDGPVTRSSVPFISVTLYFLVLGHTGFIIQFVTFCKEIQTDFLQNKLR